MAEGGMSCVKYLMFFFNLLIFLAGAAMLGIGIWVAVSAESFKNIVSSDPSIFNSVYVIIAVGACVFLIGFLGCCGAVNENRCLLGTFFFLVLILFIVQIVGAVLAIVFKDKAVEKARESMKGYEKGNDVAKGWDSFQQTFECCGVDGPSDWGVTPPASCCVNSSLCTLLNARQEGCKDKVTNLFWIIAGVALGILLIELLAMIFSCCLYRSIGKESNYA